MDNQQYNQQYMCCCSRGLNDRGGGLHGSLATQEQLPQGMLKQATAAGLATIYIWVDLAPARALVALRHHQRPYRVFVPAAGATGAIEVKRFMSVGRPTPMEHCASSVTARTFATSQRPAPALRTVRQPRRAQSSTSRSRR
eukprot:scaffold21321_cov66-Phaeocystis_antarctica.AAC.2